MVLYSQQPQGRAYAQAARPAYAQAANYTPMMGAQQQYSMAAQYQPAAQAQRAMPAGYGYVQQAQPAAANMFVGGFGQAASAIAKSPQLIATVQKLIDERETTLKPKVISAFRHAAGTSESTDKMGLVKMRTELARVLNVPESIFGTIEDEYIRFDFDGSGYLEVNEVYKLIKFHLYEFLPSAGMNSIRTQSLQQAGYTVTKNLGAGSQGDVKLACDKYGNQRCVKMYKKAGMANMGGLANMMEEFATMDRLACKNIARTYEIFQDNNYIYMINEVYFGKDLTSVEANAQKARVPITEDWWKLIFRQCFEALSFMHQQGMMHCDIKEPNIMLRTENYADPQAVLIDFGVSKAMTAKDDGMASGTPGYMPPETMQTGKWYPGGDIFSMGVVMMQLVIRRVPDEEQAMRGIMIGIFLEGCRSIEDIKMAMLTRQPPFQLINPAWPALRQLIMRCLGKDMRSRPKAPAVLKDPWFATTAAAVETPIEQVMQPTHAMATVGITEEMMKAQPRTQAISLSAADMASARSAPAPVLRAAAVPASVARPPTYSAAKARVAAQVVRRS